MGDEEYLDVGVFEERPDYAQIELELRRRLLTRITASTYCAIDIDAELSTHSLDGPKGPS